MRRQGVFIQNLTLPSNVAEFQSPDTCTASSSTIASFLVCCLGCVPVRKASLKFITFLMVWESKTCQVFNGDDYLAT